MPSPLTDIIMTRRWELTARLRVVEAEERLAAG